MVVYNENGKEQSMN